MRIVEPFSYSIDCDSGWEGLLADLHNDLMEVDPQYEIMQVKEKFGGLRFYARASNEDLESMVAEVILHYEAKSYTVCEVTGGPGMLMTKDGVNKTLSFPFMDEGWAPVLVY